ncbi:MAG: hypothetical protein A3E79_11750 [Burkholderiales bacterium RIFCSPHIGHO2_12_FULL_61_11]|nr:MAG: hypothetical protein A3E79_11750 [Burkholderiales bacterium RIFCSPHIGHO2_12_FULL_61_11]
MSVNNHNAVLDAIVASLAAAMPTRFVQRSLVDPANALAAQLLAGLVCVVNEGGGDFANYRGREGDLGKMDVRLVGFVKVDEGTVAADVERAELDLLGSLLLWVNTTAVPGLDVVTPGDWTQSKQLEHPYGWLALALTVKT